MMQPRSFGGDPAEQVPRDSVMGGYSADSSTGIATVQDFFVGPTATAHDFTGPCFAG